MGGLIQWFPLRAGFGMRALLCTPVLNIGWLRIYQYNTDERVERFFIYKCTLKKVENKRSNTYRKVMMRLIICKLEIQMQKLVTLMTHTVSFGIFLKCQMLFAFRVMFLYFRSEQILIYFYIYTKNRISKI